MKPRPSPSSDYLHPLCLELVKLFREERKRAKVSRKRMARDAQFSRSLVWQMERGVSWFSLNVWLRFCEAAGLNSDRLWREGWRRVTRRRRKE